MFAKRARSSWVHELPLHEKQSMVDGWNRYAEKQRELFFKSHEPPAHVQAAAADVDAADQHWIGWSTEELAAFAEKAGQQRLPLSDEDTRANVRLRMYRKLVDDVRPAYPERLDLVKRALALRDARRHGRLRYSRKEKRLITIWDSKAGDRQLCPDDAREEAMRVQRRIVPAILETLRADPWARVYTAVFTKRTVERGQLKSAQRAIYKEIIALIRKCKRDGSLPLLGAYAVMESPLTAERKWHAHVNVILVTHGWLEWRKLHALWGQNVHVDTVPSRRRCRRIPNSTPGRPTESQLQAALRELIKYAARAIAEKSEEKAAAALEEDDEPPPPAMEDWTPAELVEYLDAQKGFRKSRGYGCLYRVDDPEPLDLSSFEDVGSISHDGRGYRRRIPLLESILGDKSSTGVSGMDVRKWHIEALHKLLGPPDHLDRVCDAFRTIKKLYGPISLATE